MKTSVFGAGRGENFGGTWNGVSHLALTFC